jgi:hypothetical protein
MDAFADLVIPLSLHGSGIQLLPVLLAFQTFEQAGCQSFSF